MSETGSESSFSVSDRQSISGEITPEWSRRLASQDLVARYGNRVDPITLRVARNRPENEDFWGWLKDHPRLGSLATVTVIAFYLNATGNLPFFQRQAESYIPPSSVTSEISEIRQEENSSAVIEENPSSNQFEDNKLENATSVTTVEAGKAQNKSFEELLFKPANEQEKAQVEEMVRKQIKYYTERDGKKLDVSKRIQKTKDLEPLVKEVLQSLNIKPDSLSAQLILPTIFVESGGDPNQVSEDGAEGLGQLLSGSVESLLKLKENNSNFRNAKIKFIDKENKIPDLFDERTNITLSLIYLDNLVREFNEIGILAYYMGDGNMINVVKNYAYDYKNMSWADIESILDSTDKPGTAKLLGNVNTLKILNSKYLQGQIALGTYKANTLDYVGRVAASYELLNGQVK